MMTFNGPNEWMYIHPESSHTSAAAARLCALSLHAFCYLCTIHDQRVNDPVPSLPAAHSLHAAVVVAQREMGFRAIVHKLPLQVRTHQQRRLGHSILHTGANQITYNYSGLDLTRTSKCLFSSSCFTYCCLDILAVAPNIHGVLL